MKKTFIFITLILLAVSAFAQTKADFTVALTSDGTGAVIIGYTGKAWRQYASPPPYRECQYR